ncbi:acyl-CoA thioester hydrolase/BAAT C-terminal domain-containing protein [Paraflavitalea speifideaquila]|uniref:acyl-CoA thioester hydrolase/BAAT C-terminal domain-containing protein n=1 Tax=Paraflavitalea speifideaquila TaxID=3076558 RepID=UPI0028E81DE7|nr:acyl-CoA thioester hydrolase/BAAT C-terminal domain-containing protein [Paraflavitalea speifideiaquila]
MTTKNTDAILYTGPGNNQPLIVALGGSEGGNAWASNYWKQTRDQFIEKGYAFLAIGYFNTKHSPKILDKIAIEDVYNVIVSAKTNAKIKGKKIAVVGGSRGADLALLLGSYYKDITCVIGMSGSHAVFPGHTDHFTTSCWTFEGKELPFIPVNEAAVPFLMKRDLRGTFEAMLKDTVAEQKSLIRVENINGPVLLMSGTKDDICPSTPMSEKVIARLKAHQFKSYTEHIAYEGGHAEPTKHFDKVFDFLQLHFVDK